MKKWLIAVAMITLLIGCQTAGKGPEVSLTPGPDQIKSPWAGFPERAWVLYKVTNPMDGNEYEYRDSIHNVAGDRAVVVTSIKVNDKWQRVEMKPVSLRPIGKPADKPSTTAVVKVGGKDLACKVVEMSMPMGDKGSTTMKNYMCDEVLGGLVQREMAGKVVRKAVDFGTNLPMLALAEVVQMKAPWAAFPKGSWVHYKILTPDGNEIQVKETLVEVGEEKGVVEASILKGDKWESSNVEEVSLLPMGRAMGGHKLTTLKVGDRKVNCIYVDMTRRIGDMATVMKQWMSDDVPGGIVRKEMGGKCVREVIAFGTK